MIRLVIFDVDGTLAQSSKLNLLPHVKEFFRQVLSGSCPERLKVAIATNQGGVGMRLWMEQQRSGKANKYPSQTDVETRIRRLLLELGAESRVPVYMSYRYMDKKGRWSPVPPGEENNIHWAKDWRKPSPGMLLQAMTDAGVPPEESLYVGDREEDQGAAKAAGCAFQWAKDFFKSDWGDCEAISARLNAIISTESR